MVRVERKSKLFVGLVLACIMLILLMYPTGVAKAEGTMLSSPAGRCSGILTAADPTDRWSFSIDTARVMYFDNLSGITSISFKNSNDEEITILQDTPTFLLPDTYFFEVAQPEDTDYPYSFGFNAKTIKSDTNIVSYSLFSLSADYQDIAVQINETEGRNIYYNGDFLVTASIMVMDIIGAIKK